MSIDVKKISKKAETLVYIKKKFINLQTLTGKT